MMQPTPYRRNDALIHLRERRDWEPGQVAQMCGVSVHEYRSWEEQGKIPDPVFIGRLCSLFCVTLDKLGYHRHGRSA